MFGRLGCVDPNLISQLVVLMSTGGNGRKHFPWWKHLFYHNKLIIQKSYSILVDQDGKTGL